MQYQFALARLEAAAKLHAQRPATGEPGESNEMGEGVGGRSGAFAALGLAGLGTGAGVGPGSGCQSGFSSVSAD